MPVETQNSVFAARVKQACSGIRAKVKRGNGRLVPLVAIKASAFPNSDWDVYMCMINSACKAGTLRTILYKGIWWLVL